VGNLFSLPSPPPDHTIRTTTIKTTPLHPLTMTKIVLVSTSATELKGHATGLWLEELAVPYYLFKNAGYDVVIASLAGGPVPIDKSSMMGGFFDDASKQFMVSKYLN
jgi:hypothetical protein